MTNTYKFLAWATLVLLLGLGLKVLTLPSTGKLGDGLVSTVATHFTNGINAGTSDQFSVNGSGVVTLAGVTNTGNSSVTGIATLATTTATQFTATQFLSTTVGSSSTSPAALGSAPAGFFTATTTLQSASTTAITTTSQIFLQQVTVASTVPSTLFGTGPWSCNLASATTTLVTQIIASSTSPSNNGFIIKPQAAPTGATTPYCYFYHIVN